MLKVLVENHVYTKYICVYEEGEKFPVEKDENSTFINLKDFNLLFWKGDYNALAVICGKVVEREVNLEEAQKIFEWLGLTSEIDLNVIISAAIENGNFMSLLAACDIVGDLNIFPLLFDVKETEETRLILTKVLKGFKKIREAYGHTKIYKIS